MGTFQDIGYRESSRDPDEARPGRLLGLREEVVRDVLTRWRNSRRPWDVFAARLDTETRARYREALSICRLHGWRPVTRRDGSLTWCRAAKDSKED